MTELIKDLDNMPWVLVYPEKSLRQNEITPLSFALDGKWEPHIIQINETLLADELVVLMEEEIEDKKDEPTQGNYYDIIYTDKRDPFQFDVDIEFSTITNPVGCVNPGRSVRIDRLDILASWNNKDLPIKYNKELLMSILEMQIRLPYL